MSWDPNQGQYPPSGGQQYPPSGQPPDGGQDPYSGYGAQQQNPYGAPPPQQNPYGAPPQQQNPYGAPQQQYPPNQGGYGYNPPPQQGQLPLGMMIQNLVNQYIKVLTKPSAQTFAEEAPKANWMMVWIQLIGLAVISEIFGLLGSLWTRIDYTNTGSYFAGLVGASSFAIISVPLGFFILMGIQYLLSKMFQGQGDFMTQSYTALLFYTPIRVISAVIGIIPILGGLIGIVLSIYSVILNIFQVMAVHRMNGGKASAVVLIPYAVLLLLVFLCAFLIILIFAAALRGAGTP